MFRHSILELYTLLRSEFVRYARLRNYVGFAAVLAMFATANRSAADRPPSGRGPGRGPMPPDSFSVLVVRKLTDCS